MATILVVDDQALNREYLKIVLENAGHSVLQAADAAAALRVALEQRPELVILDLDLPGRDGAALVRDLRSDERTADIRIAIHTASRTDAALEQFMSVTRIGHVIPKPAEPDVVLRFVTSALGGPTNGDAA